MINNSFLFFSFESYLYGQQVEFDELVKHPLTSEEVLMQDKYHHFHRLKVPNARSSLLDKIVYWLQSNLNTTDHLQAISNLIDLFENRVFNQGFSTQEELEQVNSQAETLRSFMHLVPKEQNQVNQRLDEIKQVAFKRRESVAFTQFNERFCLSTTRFSNKATYSSYSIEKLSVLRLNHPQWLEEMFALVEQTCKTHLHTLESLKEQAIYFKDSIADFSDYLYQLKRETQALLLITQEIVTNLKLNIARGNFSSQVDSYLLRASEIEEEVKAFLTQFK